MLFQGNPKCSGHVKGLNITEHAANGIYDGAAITVWERGTVVEVMWESGGQHRGNLNLNVIWHFFIPAFAKRLI